VIDVQTFAGRRELVHAFVDAVVAVVVRDLGTADAETSGDSPTSSWTSE
jgi:hypothetical protein